MQSRDSKDKRRKVDWSDECRLALAGLLDDITSPPILAYPDVSKEFILHTYASGHGLGAILYQKQEEVMRVIGYASRSLNKAESKYHPTKLEFLAFKWAVTDSFRDYLAYADHFWAFTDNNPLVYLMEANKLNAYGERWVSELAEYNFTIKYRPGIINRDADCLSRLPLDINQYIDLCTEELPPDAFRAIMSGLQTSSEGKETWRLSINSAEINEIDANLKTVDGNVATLISEQRKDPEIYAILDVLETQSEVKVSDSDGSVLKVLKRDRKKLRLNNDGVLVRRGKDGAERVVLPKSMYNSIYNSLHVDMGHLGSERVVELAKKRVYWPRMQQDIEDFIQTSCTCIAQKRPRVKLLAPLQNIVTSSPMELVTVDYVQLEPGLGGMQYILVIVDHFTRFTQAYATKNKTSLTAAKRLYNDFILRFGIPSKLMSDQGGEFESDLMRDLHKVCGVTKLKTTPYHPQTNGACERMNQTLLAMLRTLPEKLKSRWPESVNKMVHAYNCTKHSTTGYSPFYLLYGRDPILPIDTLIPAETTTKRQSHRKYVKE